MDATLVPGAKVPERNRNKAAHRIENVTYIPHDTDGSPITCICGWEGTSATWDEHRLRPGGTER